MTDDVSAKAQRMYLDLTVNNDKNNVDFKLHEASLSFSIMIESVYLYVDSCWKYFKYLPATSSKPGLEKYAEH